MTNYLRLRALAIATLVPVAVVVGALLAVDRVNSATGLPVAAQAAPELKWQMVGVIVNIITPTTMTNDDVKAMVDRANELLKDTRVHLFLDSFDIRRGVANPDQPADNQGLIDQKNNRKLDDFSLNELVKRFRGAGIKINIGNTISPTKVAAYSRHTSPVIDMSRLKNGLPLSPAQMAQSLAHELSHAFTNGRYHILYVSPDGTITTTADATGHTSDPSNLMYGYGTLSATKLTKAQAAEINRGAANAVLTKTLTGETLVPISPTHQLWTGVFSTSLPTYLNFDFGTWYAENPSSDLQTDTHLRGLFPMSSSVNVKIQFLLDTDHNPSSGVTVGGFTGIDKIVEIHLTGDYPFASPVGSMSAVVIDTNSEASVSLPIGSLERVPILMQVYAPALPVAIDSADSVLQSIPMALLGSLADEVPVGVRIIDLTSPAVDEAGFLWEVRPPQGPILVITPLIGDVGASMALTGTNFAPNSTINILLDDTLVATATTGSTGIFVTTTTIPPDPPGSPGPHFVIATDHAGAVDFSILTIPYKLYLPTVTKP